jgi:hypothetical protein
MAVAALKSPMRRRFDEAGLTAAIGPARFHPTVHAAVGACRSVTGACTQATVGSAPL